MAPAVYQAEVWDSPNRFGHVERPARVRRGERIDRRRRPLMSGLCGKATLGPCRLTAARTRAGRTGRWPDADVALCGGAGPTCHVRVNGRPGVSTSDQQEPCGHQLGGYTHETAQLTRGITTRPRPTRARSIWCRSPRLMPVTRPQRW